MVNKLNSIYRRHHKNYNENSDLVTLLEVDIEYPKELAIKHKDIPFLPEKRNIKKAIKLVTTIDDKEKYIVHIVALKQALNHGLKLKRVHRVITFRQKAWMTPYIDMNTDLTKEAKTDFEKDFFKLMNNSVFGKTMENVKNHRDIKLIVTLMCEFWYDYLKPKYDDKVKICYMDTDSFIIHVKTEDFYKDIVQDVNKWFDTSGYNEKDNRPLPIGINKKIIGKFKDELNGLIMTEFIALRAKVYA